MPMNQALLSEFDHEMANTRKTLERVPDDKWDWKPHQKTDTMGWLANHMAQLPGRLPHTVGSESIGIGPGGKQVGQPSGHNRTELLAIFARGTAEAREALPKATDQELQATWTRLNCGRNFFSMPRA